MRYPPGCGGHGNSVTLASPGRLLWATVAAVAWHGGVSGGTHSQFLFTQNVFVSPLSLHHDFSRLML